MLICVGGIPNSKFDAFNLSVFVILQEWKNYVCKVSETGICITVGRLTPVFYKQLMATVNVSYALYHYGPFLVELEECSFVRDTLREIGKNDCPGLRHHSRWIVMWLAMVSVAFMVSSIFWVSIHHRSRNRVILIMDNMHLEFLFKSLQ